MKNQDKIISPKNFFKKIIQQAFEDCQIQTYKMVPVYLEDLLKNYIETEKLYDIVDENGNKNRETLAEIYLKAFSSDISLKKRKNLLKKLGDTSLYVSGFFGESLKRKAIDINYYIGMGKASYKHLADYTEEDTFSIVFMEFAKRFKDFVNALTYISQKIFIRNKQSLLKLYDIYMNTNSNLAKRQLLKRGQSIALYLKRKIQ